MAYVGKHLFALAAVSTADYMIFFSSGTGTESENRCWVYLGINKSLQWKVMTLKYGRICLNSAICFVWCLVESLSNVCAFRDITSSKLWRRKLILALKKLKPATFSVPSFVPGALLYDFDTDISFSHHNPRS